MAYSVRMSDPVRAYLRALSGLSRQGCLKLLAGVLGLLRRPRRPASLRPFETPGFGSPYFRFDYLFSDVGRFWRADCVADDSATAYGLLSLVYLDCQVGT